MSDAIAVGIDGSSASRFAVEWAARRAERERCSLTLLHATASPTSAETNALILSELEFANGISPAVKATVEIMAGDTVRALAEASGKFGLVVIGTHKTGFLRGRAFGSIGPRLAAIVAVPLAVIPAPSGRPRRGIVVGIDDDLRSLPAIRLAAREAASTDSELTIIHAQPTQGKAQLAAALTLVDREYPHIVVHTRSIIGDAGEVLINATTTSECLFIGGSHPYGGGLGPVGHDVLLNISGPTILVPLERETVGAD